MSDNGTGQEGTIIAASIASVIGLLLIGCMVYLRCYSNVEETIEENKRDSIDLFGDDTGGGGMQGGGPPGLGVGGGGEVYGSPAPPTTGPPGTLLKNDEEEDDDLLDV